MLTSTEDRILGVMNQARVDQLWTAEQLATEVNRCITTVQQAIKALTTRRLLMPEGRCSTGRRGRPAFFWRLTSAGLTYTKGLKKVGALAGPGDALGSRPYVSIEDIDPERPLSRSRVVATVTLWQDDVRTLTAALAKKDVEIQALRGSPGGAGKTPPPRGK